MSEPETSVPPPPAAGAGRDEQAESSGAAGRAVSPTTTSAIPVATDFRAVAEQEFREVQRVCVFFGAMLLPVLAVMGWTYHSDSSDATIELGGGAVLYLAIAAFAIAWRREWRHLLRWPPGVSRHFIVILVALPLCSVTIAHFLGVWGKAMKWPVADLTDGFGEDGYPLWLLFVSMVVLPPLFEEVAFRGVLLAKLQRLMGPTQAIWVTAVLFGVIHFSVLSMVVLQVPLGAVAGYLTRRTGSLLPAIWLHAAHNLGVLLIDLRAEI
jgi:membrane protease YdiL (CAAX protease family)